jgi:hypothetical protein
MIAVNSDSEGGAPAVLLAVVQLADRGLTLGVGAIDSLLSIFDVNGKFEVFESKLNETRVLLLLKVTFVSCLSFGFLVRVAHADAGL